MRIKTRQIKKFFLKSIALSLVLSFSYSQLVWAADVRQMILDAKASFDQDTRRSGSMTSTDLTASQTQAAAVVDQQQALQDLQSTNFSLTTKNGDILDYVGNTLSHVTRPDGTALRNIQVDANGNILNADLKLSDGSIQIFQNGQVIGYGTPDGSTVVYSAGQIQKVTSKAGVDTLYTYNKDANGYLIETVLDNPSYTTKYDTNNKLKEVYEKASGSRTTYSNGIIQKTVKLDGSQILYNSVVQSNGDILVTPQGSGSASTYTDTQGNIFTFSSGNVASVKLKDGSTLDSIVWDAANAVKDANLTTTDGTKYVYQNKKLISITPVASNSPNIETVLPVNTLGTIFRSIKNWDALLAWTAGTDYLVSNWDRQYVDYSATLSAAGNLKVQFDAINYGSAGPPPGYPGFQIEIFVDGASQGVTVVPAFKTQWTPASILLQNVTAGNHTIRIKWLNDAGGANGTDANFEFRNLKLTQVSNPNPVPVNFTYTVDRILAVTGGVAYEYLLDKTLAKVTYADKSTTTFNTTGSYKGLRDKDVSSSGVVLTQYEYQTGSTGVITVQKREVLSGLTSPDYQPLSPVEKVDFRFNSSSTSNKISFTANQIKVGSITRTLTVSWLSGKWTLTRTDVASTTTTATSTVTQALSYGVDYVAELRFEGAKANLYVYAKSQSRPTTATGSLDAYSVATKLSASLVNATASGQIAKSLSTPSVSEVQSTPVSTKFDFVSTLSLSKPAVPSVNPTDYSSITYGADSKIKQVIKTDNSKYIFQNGLLNQVLDPLGNPTIFSFSVSDFSNITGSEIVQNGLDSKYDSGGNLSQVKVNDLTIHYQSGSNAIDFIKKTDGTQLHNLVFDANGNVTGAVITAPDGEIRSYQAGTLVNLRRQDDSQIFYAFSKPLKMITPEKLTYNFDYTAPNIVQAVLDPSIVPQDATTPVKMQYDTSFNLTKVIRQNNQVLNYLNNTLTQIDIPSSASQIFSYQKDSSGNLISSTVTQGNVVTTYDSNNNPTSAVISPTTDNPHTLLVSYQYGKIRQIKKDGVVTFNYTYAFDASNTEITQIDDLEENAFKTYQDGNMTSSLDRNNSLLSAYSYVNGSVSQVQVSRLGRNLHTYNYGYSGDMPVVTDEEGIIRTYDANKQLLYLEKDSQKFGYSYTTTSDGEKIVEEKLIEKKLPDGSAARYTSGQLTSILKTDGTMISDVTLDPNGQVTKGTATLLNGIKKVFNGSTILEEIDPDGTHFYFSDNKISTVTDPAGNNLIYSYDKDAQGNIQSVWIKIAGTNLKYDITGNLLGLRLDGVLTPEEVKAQATHVYQGGSNGPFGIDGDFNSWQYESYGHSSGGIGTVSSEHDFPAPQTISSVTFRMYAHGDASGPYITDYEALCYVEVLQNNTWVQVPGSFRGSNKIQGNGSLTVDTGIVTLNNLNLQNVQAVRAYAHGFGNTSGSGSAWGAAGIYEIQWSLADQSYLNFRKSADTLGNTTGYSFQGYPGAINYDTQGNPLAGTPANLNSIAQSLTGKTNLFNAMPYKPNLILPAGSYNSSWLSASQESTLDSQTIASQEYSADGTLQTQTKADGTVTLFDNNKPSEVLDSKGTILIQYSYDADGNPSRVYLKNARDTLPDEVLKARQSIEEGRAASLLTLAQQKNLAYQSIQSQVAAQKQALQSQLNSLQDQFNQVGNTPASGKKAKNARGDVLNQIGSSMDQVRGALANLSSQEADAYAALDSQVKSVSDQIEADSQTAFTALAGQEANLKKEILRQEVSPVVYDTYRRILGRDPSSSEYDYWIAKTDYNQDPSLSQTYATVEQQSVDPKTLAFKESSGQLFIEAENYHTLAAKSGRTWVKSSQDPSFSSSYAVTAQGSSYYDSTGIDTNSTRLDYKIYVNTPGTYYLWVRGYAADGNSDSLHAGLDGVISDTTPGYRISNFSYGQYVWSKTNMQGQRVAFTVSTAGEHTLNFWIREVGFKFDKFILTQDANFVPSGISLNESQHVPAPPTVVSKPLTQALKDYLNALPELQERQAYVATVKQNVTTQINSFLAMSDAQKQVFAASLGLQASDLINLSASDAQKILTWLNARSLHFGQSAFLALESLLDQKGIVYTRTDLAQKAILVDVLTGVISPLDDGDLVISMFALNKVASLYGVSLSGANLSWDDLKSIYDANKASIPGSSVRFNGAGDYLSVPNSADFDFGTGDFTYEVSIKFNDKSTGGDMQRILLKESGGVALFWSTSGTLSTFIGPGDNITAGWAPSNNVWYHLAVTRSGTDVRLFVDGVQLGSTLTSGYNINSSTPFLIGQDLFGGRNFNGWMDDIRISKGVARYTQNYTPSSQHLTADSYTKFLLYADPQQGIKDFSAASHPITIGGSTNVATLTTPSTQGSNNNIPRIIAHINGNHYVVITGITQDTITYIDPGAGPDKQNQVETITKAQFMKGWKGNVTAASALLNPVVTASAQKPVPTARFLTPEETQKIRGAFFFFFIPLIFAAIANIGAAVFTVISAIGTIIASIGSLVGTILSGVGQFLGAVFNAIGYIGNAIWQGISFAASSLWGALGNVGSFLSQNVFGSMLKASFGNTLFQQAVRTGLNFAVSRGLESLGVNPTISNLISAFVTGGYQGLANPISVAQAAEGVTRATMIASSIFQSVAIEGIGQLGIHFGLDSGFTNILSLSLAAIGGQVIQNPSTTLEKAFSNIKPQLFSSLSQYGIDRLGSSLGLDPRISGLIGAPISAGIGTVFDTGRNAGITIMNSVQAGMIQGALAYGLSFTGTSSPFIGSLLSRDITNNLALAIGRDGLFNTVFNILGRTALNVVNVVGGAVKTVFEGITSFGTTIQQKGLAGALESLVSSIFSRNAQEAILQKGGVQGLFNSTPKTPVTLRDGRSGQELKIDGNNSLFFDDVSHLIGRKDEGIYQLGDFGYDSYGNFSLLEGNVYANLDGDLDLYGGVRDGQFISIKIDGPSGTLLQVDPEKPGQSIFIEGPKPDQPNPSFNFWGSVFNLLPFGLSLFLKEGVANAAEVKLNPVSSNPVTSLIDIVLMNGVRLFDIVPEGDVPDYFQSGNPLRQRLNSLGVSDQSIKAIPLFEGFGDLFNWFAPLKLAKEIENTFIQIKKNQPTKPFVPLAYSGAGSPLLLALSDPSLNYRDFGIATAVLVGTPFFDVDTTVKTSSLKQIINVYGSDDLFLNKPSSVPHISKRFTHLQHPMETINIELKDIGHTEYFYKSGDNPTPEQIKASNFIARLTQAARNANDLNDLLFLVGTPTITSYVDPATNITHVIKTYVVDTKNLPANLI